MDFIVSRNPDWGLNLERESQLDYLISKGLKPETKFLDYGCGAISAGRFFISFLNKGNYVGVDISSGVINEAKKRITRFNLDNKEPYLAYAVDGKINELKFQKFDFIWAQSVITHMPPESVETMFKQLRNYMNNDSKFFFTFTKTNEGISHTDLKDWAYSIEELNNIAKNNGITLIEQNDWVHNVDDEILEGTDSLVIARIL
tara:strand:- start:194 stop:799 length:606 start_codon:yes stop_codon:yes gene_type:complete